MLRVMDVCGVLCDCDEGLVASGYYSAEVLVEIDWILFLLEFEGKVK